jgi:putative membrane protein
MTAKANLITGIAALALVFGAGPAFAQYNNSGTRGNSGTQGTYESNQQTANSANTTSTSDNSFAQKAAQGDMAEVKLGELAEQKGTIPDVKNFGKRMVQDHSKNSQELQNVASRENVALPSQVNKTDQNTYDRLSKLSGEAFDRAYARDMVKDHTHDVSEFQKEANDGRNAAIKNYAAQTVPVLQTHLDLAKQMQEAVNRTGSDNAANRRTSGTTYPSNSNTPAGNTNR